MRRAPLALVPLATLMMATLMAPGCKQAQAVGGKPRPKSYRAIVSLSPSTTELLAGNGIPIVGRTSADDYPERLTAPIVGGVKPDYEALARIKPDLIVYDAELYGDAEVRKLQETGAKLFKYDPRTFDEYTRAVYEIGSLSGTETTLSSFVDRTYAEKANAEGDVPNPRPKVAIILPDSSGRHLIGGTQGLRAECVKIAGGDQIGPDSARFEPLSPEFLIKEDPDVIISAGAPEAFERDPRFAGLKARRTNNVRSLAQDIVLRRGARVDKLIDNFHKAFSQARERALAATAGTN